MFEYESRLAHYRLCLKVYSMEKIFDKTFIGVQFDVS